MNISRQQAETILTQIKRKCFNCKFDLDPLSSRCIVCKTDNPFTKIDEDSYYEHFELRKCEKHLSVLHWCVHPKIDCKYEDLISRCSKCIADFLDEKGPSGPQPITTQKV